MASKAAVELNMKLKPEIEDGKCVLTVVDLD